MRGLGWLYTQDGNEILNDRRLMDRLGGALPSTAFSVNTFAAMSAVLNWAWAGCAANEFFLGETPTFDELTGLMADPTDSPWYEAADPISANFWGFFVEEFEGLPIEYERTVNQRAWDFGGANFTPLRPRHAALEYTVALVGSSELALEYGIQWLTEKLRGCSGCEDYGVVLFPADPSVAVVGTIDDALLRGYWMLEKCGLLDAPRWTEEPVERLNCFLRRVTFTLGARDPHLYKCKTICVANTSFSIPEGEGEGGCYTWEQWFCNDEMDPISCEVFDAPDLPNCTTCAVVSLLTTEGDGAPVIIETVNVDGTIGIIRTTELPQDSVLRIDGARHTVEITFDLENRIEWSDGSEYIWGRDDDGALGWPESCGDGATMGVRPYRVCNAENTAVTIETVIRQG